MLCYFVSIALSTFLVWTLLQQDHGHSESDAPEGQTSPSSPKDQCHFWASTAQSCSSEDHDQETQEAQLGQPQVCTSTSFQWSGSCCVHPRGRTQPPGAQCGAGKRREDTGLTRGQTQGGQGQI